MFRALARRLRNHTMERINVASRLDCEGCERLNNALQGLMRTHAKICAHEETTLQRGTATEVQHVKTILTASSEKIRKAVQELRNHETRHLTISRLSRSHAYRIR